MKQRKEARKERAEKKVKTVIVDGDRETPYDFEKVLLELGEVMYLIIWVKHLQFYVPGKKMSTFGFKDGQFFFKLISHLQGHTTDFFITPLWKAFW